MLVPLRTSGIAVVVYSGVPMYSSHINLLQNFRFQYQSIKQFSFECQAVR